MDQPSATTNTIEATDLGKRYGSFWALRNCSITVPRGAVSAVVGPNGAGKTTLLKILACLSGPSTGRVAVLNQTPAQTSRYLADIGYLGQEIPLYARLSVRDHLAIGASLNSHWDGEVASSRLSALYIPLDKPVEQLSGGQKAQVGLALALAKKPKLLLLDEPVAALDPLARVDFLTSLANAAAEARGDLTVVMSSHLLADLERVCDHVTILAAGKTQLSGSISEVIRAHKVLLGPPFPATGDGYTIITHPGSEDRSTLLVRIDGDSRSDVPAHMRDADIEEVVLAYIGQHRGGRPETGDRL